MAPVYSFQIEQGATYSAQWQLLVSDGTPRDLTGYSFYAQFNSAYSSSGAFTFQTAIISPATSGTLNISYPASQSALLNSGVYVWDGYLESGSGTGLYRERIAQGLITVDPQVTTV